MLGLCATLLAHIWIKYVFLPAILGCLLTFKKHDNGKNYVLRTRVHFATLHDFAGYLFSIAWHRIDFEWSWLRTPERYWYYRSIPEWVAWHWCSEWGKKVAATWSILAQPNWKSYWWSLNHPNISALGVKGRLNNVKKKTCTIGGGWLPLSNLGPLWNCFQLSKPTQHIVVYILVFMRSRDF